MTNATAPESAPLNVLFVTHAFPRYAGDAAGSFILRLASALREHAVGVTVLAPHAAGLPRIDRIEDIDVLRYRYAPSRFETLAYTGTMAEQVRSSWAARTALISLLGSGFWSSLWQRQRQRPSLLHAHWWFPSGVIGAAVTRLARLPMVMTMHGSDVRLARTAAPARAAFRWVMRSSRAATTVSRWLASQAHEMAPTLAAPSVAPMPAATDLFFPAGPRDNGRLLFVGRLNAQKGVELLLRGFAQIRHPLTLDIVGDGNDGTTLRQLASSLGIGDRVVWHGSKPQHELPAFYRRATALVIPSRDEGLGLVAVEGQLCETPVIGFDSGGLPDIITHNVTGILVRDFSPAALAGAIDALLDNENRSELGRAGRQAALSVFSPEAVAATYAALYRRVLTASSVLDAHR